MKKGWGDRQYCSLTKNTDSTQIKEENPCVGYRIILQDAQTQNETELLSPTSYNSKVLRKGRESFLLQLPL